ncbi:MFS transporter [Nemania sp. FL0916]|nr:MFS transporter [Nemania sp. FL0916]
MIGATISANPLKLDVRSHTKCILICFIATVSTFQYGLDYALIGGFLSMPGFLKVYGYYDTELDTWNINPTVQQLISSLMTIGTLIGSVLVGPFSSKFGRKPGLWSAALLNFVATAIMLGTTNIGALYFARLLLGVSVGWFLTFSQLYVHEVAPAHLRGITFAVYQCQLSIGSIVGAAVDFGTKNIQSRRSYQIPLAIFFVAPTIQSIALFFFPESPRWLAVQGREAEAETSLRKLRNSNINETELLAEFNEIKQSTREQVELAKKALFVEMWRGTNLRRTLLSIAVICFHSANGSSWVNIYTTYYLTIAGVSNPFGFSILITSLGLLGAIFSSLFVRFIDRRSIMIVGASICGLTQLAQAIAWTVSPGSEEAGRVVVAFIGLFTFFYVAYAPFAWLLGGEYPNSALRGYCFGIATALNFLGNFLGTLTAPYFINPASLGWGPKYGYIWFASNTAVALFAYVFLPETRDRTLEEIHEMFENKVPARKFKTYVCVGVETYAAGARKESVHHEELAVNEKAVSSSEADSKTRQSA